MMIFDAFADRVGAEAFAEACRARGKSAWVWKDQDVMEDAWASSLQQSVTSGAAAFPFCLDGTVVTVERDEDDAIERTIEHLVVGFGGRFAGT